MKQQAAVAPEPGIMSLSLDALPPGACLLRIADHRGVTLHTMRLSKY